MANPSLQELLTQLIDEKPKKRLQAVQGLAKLGDPSAIPMLAKVYEIDTDKKVQAEAQKALARFRAHEMAAKAPAAGGSKIIKMLNLLLALTLVGLIGVNIVLRLTGSGDDEKTVYTPTDRQFLIQQVTNNLTSVRQDAEALQEEWGRIGTPNGQLDCNRTFNRTQKMTLSSVDRYTYPDIANILSARYENIFFVLSPTFSDWDRFCSPTNSIEPGISDSVNNADRLNIILANVDTLTTSLNTVINNPVPTNDPQFCCKLPSGDQAGPSGSANTPVPAATVPNLAEVTPLPNVNYPTHVTTLDELLRSAEFALNDLTARYDVIRNGGIADCFNMPVAGEAYVLPPDQVGDLLLDQAVQAVTNGLTALKQSIEIFNTNCNRTQPAGLVQGEPLAIAARTQFEQARQLIDQLKTRSGLP